MEQFYFGNQSLMARELGIDRQKLRRSMVGDAAKPDLDLLAAVSKSGRFDLEWLKTGQGRFTLVGGLGLLTAAGGAGHGRTRPPAIESNAELVELGESTLWIPLYPARLAAGGNGGEPEDFGPEGAVPLPGGFARAQGLGDSPNFSAYVRGDSMRDDFDDGDLVFGLLQEEWDREGVYALYLRGELLVKRVRRTGRDYDLISTNPKYSPIPIDTDDVRLIGRVVGAISRV